MKKHKINGLISVILFLICISLSSCKISEGMLKGSSEVDFTTPQKLQISFNDHIYDTTVVMNDKRLEINFSNEKDLLSGAYVCLTENAFKMTYKDMAFGGSTSELLQTFLPCIIYSFLISYDDKIVMESYDEKRECYYLKKEVNGYFVNLECYENNGNEFYSMEIK